MYLALWRVLPGPLWLRILICVVAIAAIVAALFFFVYPWVASVLTPRVESTVE